MRHIIFLFVTMLILNGSTIAQNAPERTAPYSAVKWLQANPYVMVNDGWYLLVKLHGTEANKIVAFCKQEKGDRWQKWFSEDIVEVMQKMGKPLPTTVEMLLIKDGKTQTVKAEMTKENRRAAWKYNNDNPSAEKMSTQKEVVAQTQKDIASAVNITMDKPFLCKSAKIEFTYTGHKMFAGKETLYIDDYGKTVISIVDKPGMMNQRENSTTIWKDNKTTVYNHVKKNYYTTPVRPKSTEPPVISYSTETQRKQGGYNKKGNETVVGMNCDVYEHEKMKVTYWLWKNVDVKLINYSMGGNMGYTKEATSIQENITIPAELFSVPSGYNKQ
ncbi:MAG: beta-lactamase [Flavipsychrobacter sp.]|jgi:hypothetical protein|nr:beta-lactamase [Flavipsychrobacter sp.]